MRLIDADVFKTEWHMANECQDCKQNTRNCQYDVIFTRMDICEMIDSAPTVGEWVSVKDRLPEEKENPLTKDFAEVVCFCDFGGIPKRTDVRTFKFGKRTWSEEGHFWDEGQLMDGVVTHWMPLPEPPKEDNNEGS